VNDLHSHHDHPHHHEHHHAHDISPDSIGHKIFATAIVFNTTFVVVEVGFGLHADSLSLLADAGHNFSDVIGLFASWAAMIMAKRLPTTRFTYGLRSSTILAALANAMLLLIAVGGVTWEAIMRLNSPQAVNGMMITWVALFGVAINVATALMLMRGRKDDINQRGAYLHMLGDAVIALGVAAGGVLVVKTGWLWLDPAISLVIAILILVGTWGLFKQSFRLALQAVPDQVDAEAVKTYLSSLPPVSAVHDFHVWGMSTTENALTAHLVTPAGHPGDAFLHEVSEELAHHFHIHHVTIQTELGDNQCVCSLVNDAG
jgi:cobalt-zinc-cadmium efflux system protein